MFRNLSLIICAFLFTFSLCFAETEQELKGKVDSLNNEIKQLENEINAYNKQVAETHTETTTLKNTLTALETEKKLLEKKVSYTKVQLDKTKGDISVTSNSLQKTKESLALQRKSIREIIVSLHQNVNEDAPLLSLLSKDKTISDSVQRLFQSDTMNNALQEKISSLSISRENLEQAQTIFEKKKEDLSILQKTLTDEQDSVKETVQEKNALLVETKNKESEYQKILLEKKKKKNDLEKEVGDFEAKLKTIVDASKIPKIGTGALSYPVEKVIITQYFGNTPFATANSQIYNGHGHNGIDFGVPRGTKILSAQDGTVLGTGNTDESCSGASYGKWVLIKHANGLTSLYAHLSSFLTYAGATVRKGDVIALSGNTGYSTGPHLHFTVYASDAVHITGPTEYKSKACGTYMVMPVAPVSGYLNPLTFF